MTEPTRPTSEQVEGIVNYLDRRGLRRTRARRRVVEGLLTASGHFTADELTQELRVAGLGVSRASVYRMLGLLVDGGFVEMREFGPGQRVYECMVGRRHHDHLICVSCRKILEFENEEIEKLQDAVARTHGFRLEHHSLRLYGVCEVCRNRRPSLAERPPRARSNATGGTLAASMRRP